MARVSLDSYEAAVKQGHNAAKKVFRIVATHHPIHHPSGAQPQLTMGLTRAHDVAASVNGVPTGVPSHLVLSGHTHGCFPSHSRLPPAAAHCHHPPLGTEQVQLVVGTLCQLEQNSPRGLWPFQAQLLRIYANRSTRDRVLVERYLVVRASGSGVARGSGVGGFFVTPCGPNDYEEIEFAI